MGKPAIPAPLQRDAAAERLHVDWPPLTGGLQRDYEAVIDPFVRGDGGMRLLPVCAFANMTCL